MKSVKVSNVRSNVCSWRYHVSIVTQFVYLAVINIVGKGNGWRRFRE